MDVLAAGHTECWTNSSELWEATSELTIYLYRKAFYLQKETGMWL